MGTKGSTISRLSSWDGAGPDGLSPQEGQKPWSRIYAAECGAAGLSHGPGAAGLGL